MSAAHFASAPTVGEITALDQAAAEARVSGETPIIDAGLIDALLQRADAHHSHPVRVATALAEIETEQRSGVGLELQRLGLSYGSEAHTAVVVALSKNANAQVEKSRQLAISQCTEHEAELRKVLVDVETAEQSLNRPAQYLQRLFRMSDGERDSALRLPSVPMMDRTPDLRNLEYR